MDLEVPFDRELKKQKAEEKRLEAIRLKKEEDERRRKVIAASLKDIDNVRKSKRIVFSDSEDDEKNDERENKKNSIKLFDDEEGIEESGEDLIKSRHVGKKAAKLMKLESRFGYDERFRMDKNFLDDEEESEVEMEVDGDDIRHKEKKSDLVRPFIKYDPSNPSHVEWMKKYKSKVAPKTGDKEEENKMKDEKIVVEGQFFKVDDSLKNELNTASSFSFLQSIGRPEEKNEVIKKEEPKEDIKEEHVKKKKESKQVAKPTLNSVVIKKFFISPNTDEFRSVIANFRRTQKEENIKKAFTKAQPSLDLCYQAAKKNAKRKLRDTGRKLVYNKFRK
uniref:NUC153 domain-containing protein n=1 Tax=Parastrongyloides trichosuri TaxID=131310 RepID=A0A0N4Z592_PARTI